MPDLSLLQELQAQITPQDKKVWMEAGATKTGELWQVNGRTCLPRSLYPMMANLAHGPTHLSKGAMSALVLEHWFAPGIQTLFEKFVQGCLTCARHSPGRFVKTPKKHTPKPLYPFQRVQVDYIQLPKVSTYEYVLVAIDVFSGWPEAWSVTTATAKNTAKKILSEVVCRDGIPEVIESDRGTHFTGEIMGHILKTLGITQALHSQQYGVTIVVVQDGITHEVRLLRLLLSVLY